LVVLMLVRLGWLELLLWWWPWWLEANLGLSLCHKFNTKLHQVSLYLSYIEYSPTNSLTWLAGPSIFRYYHTPFLLVNAFNHF
jgi:hypothetical protein